MTVYTVIHTGKDIVCLCKKGNKHVLFLQLQYNTTIDPSIIQTPSL